MILRVLLAVFFIVLVQRADSRVIGSMKKEMEGLSRELAMDLISSSIELEATMREVKKAKETNGCKDLSDSLKAGEEIIAQVPRITLEIVKTFSKEIDSTFSQCIGLSPFRAVNCFQQREASCRHFAEETRKGVLGYKKTIKSCTDMIKFHFMACLNMIQTIETDSTSSEETFEELSNILLNKIQDYTKDMVKKLIKQSGIVKNTMDAIQTKLNIKNINLNDCYELFRSFNDAKDEITAITNDTLDFTQRSDGYTQEINKCKDLTSTQLQDCIKQQESLWAARSAVLATSVQDHVKKVQDLVNAIQGNFENCIKPRPPPPAPEPEPAVHWNPNYSPNYNEFGNSLPLGVAAGIGAGLTGAAMGALEGAEGGPLGMIIGGLIGGLRGALI